MEALYLVDPDGLARVGGGGRAIAGLFRADRRRMAQAWLAAVELARSGREAARLELSLHRAAAEEVETQEAIAARLAALQAQTTERRDQGHETTPRNTKRPSGPGRTRGVGSHENEPDGDATSTGRTEGPPRSRVLVDPETLTIVDPNGTIVAPAPGNGDSRAGRQRGPDYPNHGRAERHPRGTQLPPTTPLSTRRRSGCDSPAWSSPATPRG